MKITQNKLVVVLNNKVLIGKTMNALAHVMLGIGNGVLTKNEVRLIECVDRDQGLHLNISRMPIIILKAGSNQLITLRQKAVEYDLRFVDFTDTMCIGTNEEEHQLTKTKKDRELEYWAIVLFGPKPEIDQLTKKYSLYN